jgi:hypothetical protein
MNATGRRWLRLLVFFVVSSLLDFAFACNANSAREAGQASAKTSRGDVQPANSDDAGINLRCIADHINKAPAPFHWSYKTDVPPFTNADWEADISSDSIEGTLRDASGSRTIHGVRADASGWNTAVLVLTGPLPASTFALVQNSSATSRVGVENINGVETLKYSIDTANDTPADSSMIRSVLGANGFIKGAAWVTSAGCPVKFTLDVEQHDKDGTVQKEHYEANVTRN